jgi:hypothetical protein
MGGLEKARGYYYYVNFSETITNAGTILRIIHYSAKDTKTPGKKHLTHGSYVFWIIHFQGFKATFNVNRP